MEVDSTHRVRVVAQSLVREAAQVEVEPLHLLVEGADDQVVTAGVDRHRGDPFGAGLQFLSHFLEYTYYKFKVILQRASSLSYQVLVFTVH